MTSSVNHVLLTRFNLPSRGHESLVRASETWLRDRVALFERYCLPSVRAQTCPDFSWLVYFDPGSPQWLLDWIASHEEQGHFVGRLREEVPHPTLLADLRSVAGQPAPGGLMTTNLDNDDSIAPDLVARLQAAVVPAERAAVYVGDGLIVRGDRLYRRTDPHNAFCSVREAWDQPLTCWADWHNLLPDHMPAVVLQGRPGWLQVVHGANVSNRVRGSRVRPSAYATDFPWALDGLPDPRPGELLRDIAVARPVRAGRETGRAVVKTAVRSVLGREGLDRVKQGGLALRRRVAG
jgi:Putative rhamnosyl transferase